MWKIIRSYICTWHMSHLLLCWSEPIFRHPAVFKEHESYRFCAQTVRKEEIIDSEIDNNRIMLKWLSGFYILKLDDVENTENRIMFALLSLNERIYNIIRLQTLLTHFQTKQYNICFLARKLSTDRHNSMSIA